MSTIKVIITGATGMVGEGVLFECLQNANVIEVLIVNRKHYDLQHPKLKELIVPDFFQLSKFADRLKGYDACFFCAGISSVGMKEEKFRHITYDTTLAFARAFLEVNTNSSLTYVSGSHTDSSEKGKVMWARVKGKTENDLAKLPFRAVYNFRPGVMLPFPGQKNWKPVYRFIAQIMRFLMRSKVLSVQEVGQAMINAVLTNQPTQILEIPAIRTMANK